VSDAARLLEAQEPNFARWEVLKDIIDQQIDLMLYYRQSGHPGGSRSKAHYFISLCLSGAMRWDIRDVGGLPGHAEMAGKILFVKLNTGPSGHGAPAAVSEALALKCAGAGQVACSASRVKAAIRRAAGTRRRTRPTAWAWTTCA
jgi:hypothetical protein